MDNATAWQKAHSARVGVVECVGDILWGEVYSSTTDEIYTPWIRRDGKFYCGCGWSVHHPGEPCHHLYAVTLYASREQLAKFVFTQPKFVILEP